LEPVTDFQQKLLSDIILALHPRCEDIARIMKKEGSVSAALAPIALPDVDRNEIILGSLWADQPAVVVFLRHYG
jgi:hypothetical protein